MEILGQMAPTGAKLRFLTDIRS